MRLNILDLLLPRETKFYDYLIEQVDVLIGASKILREFVININSMSDIDIKAEVVKIKEHERKGDAVESKIIAELNKTFITPFDREDIHSMTINIDRAMDIMNSMTNKIEIYGIKSFPKNVINFADIILEISTELKNLITELRSKNNVDATIKKIHLLENNADYLFHISIGDLFKEESNPIEIIKFKEIYELLENITDAVDFVGKIVRRIMIKQG